MTLEEVDEKFKVTRERVRQLQNDSIRKMRNLLTDKNKQRSKRRTPPRITREEKNGSASRIYGKT